MVRAFTPWPKKASRRHLTLGAPVSQSSGVLPGRISFKRFTRHFVSG
jgi:hypothetical protein